MRNFLLKLRQNKISFSFAVVFTVAITAICVISMLMYYMNTKIMINDFIDKSVSSTQKEVVTNLFDAEQLSNKTTYQILSTRSIYEVVSDMTSSVEQRANASDAVNNFIKSDNIFECYIVRKQDKKLFTRNLSVCPKEQFDTFYMSLDELIDNFNSGIRTQPANNNSSFLLLTSYDFRGFYVIYIYNKNAFFKDILNPIEELYGTSIYCQDILLYSSGKTKNLPDNKIENTVGNYKIVSYRFDEAQKSFYQPFFRQFLLFAVILLAISIILLLWSTTSMTSKTEKYIQSLISHSKQNQISLIKSTIQKIVNTQDISQTNHDIVVDYFKKIEFKEIYCFHIQLDNIEHLLLTSSYKGISRHMQSIQTVLKNKLSTLGTCIIFDFSFDSTGIILAANDFFSEEVIKEKIKDISRNIEELFNLTVTCTMSEAINLIDDIFYILIHLNSLKNYRFITGYNSIITDSTEDKANKNLEYPVETEKEIISALISCRNADFNDCLNKFYSYTSRTTFDNAKKWCTQLILSLFKHSNSTNAASILSSALKYDVLENEIEFLKVSFEKTFDTGDNETHIASNAFIQKLNEIIEKEYKNPDFNLSYLADILGISVVYAGKKFKKTFDKSFNTYLAEYRVAQAALLLEANDSKNNSDIAQLCGFSSTAYFIKTFKKITSLTPLEYKKKLTENESPAKKQ